ncbi:MAG TPA: ABC transporter permease [Pyrinomonadaceae bacterium]|jgi:predicted permease
METLWKDLRYSLRTLMKNPGFVGIVLFSLGLGIGFNVTIFSLVNAVLLRPLPLVEQPDQLVEVYSASPNLRFGAVSYPDYVDLGERTQAFDGLIAQRTTPMNIGHGGQSEILAGTLVSGNYFSVLGVKPEIGRTFSPEEDRTPNTHPVVVISHNLWQNRFKGETSAVGRTLSLNGVTYNIIGVAPKDFIGTIVGFAPDVWVPLMMQGQIIPGSDRLKERGQRWLNVVGRLKNGVSVEQARADLQSVVGKLAQDYPETNRATTSTVVGLGEGATGFKKDLAPVLQVLMVIVLLVLLIACFNVANLLLARSYARQKEIGIRLALGASRWRLVRQLLTESLLLSVMGGVAGLLVAKWGASLLLSLVPQSALPLVLDLSIDRRVMLFALVVSVVTGIIFGLIPALQTTKPDILPILKDEMPNPKQGKTRLRGLLVVGQVAISLVLLITAGLFIRSLQNARSNNLNFKPQNILVASTDVAMQGYDKNQGQAYYRQLQERAAQMPQVRNVTLANVVPLSGGGTQQRAVTIEQSDMPANTPLAVDYNVVEPKFFEALAIPVLEGRDFNWQDAEDKQKVVVINEEMARRFWPNQNALGKRIGTNGVEGMLEVVGIVKNDRYYNLNESVRPYMYLPFQQHYNSRMNLLVHASVDANVLLPALRGELQSLNRDMPYRLLTMTDSLGLALAGQRLAAVLLSIFGFLALGLAAMGLYGVMSYSVNQRTREIGILMALGAQQGDVLGIVMRQGLVLTGVGLAVGLAASFALTRFLSNLLYGIGATDLFTFGVISLILAAVAGAAVFLPARRATKVDPMIALRYE